MNYKQKFRLSYRRTILFLYLLWIIYSVFLATTHPARYAVFFSDLPTQDKILPPFVLSMIYLVLFVPAIVSVVLYLAWLVFQIIFKKTE